MKNHDRVFDFNKIVGLNLIYKSPITGGETEFTVKDYSLYIERVGDKMFITTYLVSEKGNSYRCDDFTEIYFKE